MDTVQNIGSVIVGNSTGQAGQQQPRGAVNIDETQHFYGPNLTGSEDRELASMRDSAPRRPGTRQEFLSRPNWLFGHNENVLFCTALIRLRFEDQNNVPRKFIEEWLSECMVNMETEWQSGSRFLNETITELEKDTSKFEQKKQRIWHNRQRGFYNRYQLDLRAAEKNVQQNPTEEAKAELAKAQTEAAIPVEQLNPPVPTVAEVALEELQTKIIRRLQGQTDRMVMANQLAFKPYIAPNQGYFEDLQHKVLEAINEKHDEIVSERDSVEAKSKQSRKRRRNQVSNGTTLSGSATRVRFTNREIAMLIHWVYTYPKEQWSQLIFDYYIEQESTRSAEHVRDKIRDLVTRSRDTKRGGLSTIKARSSNNYLAKMADSEEMKSLASHDLQSFVYPDGVLDKLEMGRYFDEERGAWRDGPLPPDYVSRYHDEISRVRSVVRSKVARTAAEKQLKVEGIIDENQIFAGDQLEQQNLQGDYAGSSNQFSTDEYLAKSLRTSNNGAEVINNGTEMYWDDQAGKSVNKEEIALAAAAINATPDHAFFRTDNEAINLEPPVKRKKVNRDPQQQ